MTAYEGSSKAQRAVAAALQAPKFEAPGDLLDLMGGGDPGQAVGAVTEPAAPPDRAA